MLVARKRFKYHGSVILPGEALTPQPRVGTTLYQRLLDGRFIEEEGAERTEGFPCRMEGCKKRLVSIVARRDHERKDHPDGVREAAPSRARGGEPE